MTCPNCRALEAEVASLTARIGEVVEEMRAYVDAGWLLYIEEGTKTTFEVRALRTWAAKLTRLRAEHETP